MGWWAYQLVCGVRAWKRPFRRLMEKERSVVPFEILDKEVYIHIPYTG